MGNVDDDGATFQQSYVKCSNGTAKASTPISNGHIPNQHLAESWRDEQQQPQQQKELHDDQEEEMQQLLLSKQLKFSAPAYTEIRTRSGGLNFKVSGPKKRK